jgi:predicted molibdopterin-dependent oxidoreductase YjgC
MISTVTIIVDGKSVEAPAGISLGALLHERNGKVLRHTPGSGSGRGLFCGMGVCFDCLVTVDGHPDRRACMTVVREGMIVELPA